MKNFNSVILLSLAFITGFTACKKNKGDEEIVNVQETVTKATEELKAKPEVSTFTNAFKAVELSPQDVAEGITLFAPINDAITSYNPTISNILPKAAIISATDSSKLTQSVLKDHIIKGNIKPADLTNGKTLVSVSGKEYKIIRKGDSIRVNGVLLTPPPAGSTSMVYTVNKLLTKTKTTDVVNNPDKLCLLSKITTEWENSTIEYDSQNRPVKINEYDGQTLEGYITISYNSSTQIVVKYYDGTKLEETITFTLANGLAKSATGGYSYTDSGYTYNVAHQQTFEHNAEGYLTKVISQTTVTTNKPKTAAENYSGTTTYTYQNGNRTSEVSKEGDGTYTTNYEYFTDKTNNLPIDSDADELEFLITKPNKNPVKKETNINAYTGGSNTSIRNYTYEFNTAGLITKKTESYTSGSTPYTEAQTFEYNCK